MNFSRRGFLSAFSFAVSYLLSRNPALGGCQIEPESLSARESLTLDRSCFHEDAIIAMQFANQEAQWFCHDYIGTEHLVIGMYRIWENVDPGVSERVGFSVADLRNVVLVEIGKGDLEFMMGRFPKSEELDFCLRKADEMANDDQGEQVCMKQMLEAIMSVPNSTAKRIVVSALKANKS